MKRKRKDDALRKAPEGRRPAAPREKNCCPLPTAELAGKDRSETKAAGKWRGRFPGTSGE
jgi:hypothetical protein